MTIKVEAPIYTQQIINKKLASPLLLLLHLRITMMMLPVHRRAYLGWGEGGVTTVSLDAYIQKSK
jgi:hypothetical protein